MGGALHTSTVSNLLDDLFGYCLLGLLTLGLPVNPHLRQAPDLPVVPRGHVSSVWLCRLWGLPALGPWRLGLSTGLPKPGLTRSPPPLGAHSAAKETIFLFCMFTPPPGTSGPPLTHRPDFPV